MTPSEAAKVLAKAAAFDHRTIGAVDVAAWHEALSDVDGADALVAVSRHYRDSTERLMPAHVRRLAGEIRRERMRAEREGREAAAAAREIEARAVARDRSPEVAALVDQIRDVLPPGRPDVFRRPEWVDAERERVWASRPAVPNPAYQGPPPPGGWPIPGEQDDQPGKPPADTSWIRTTERRRTRGSESP